MRLKLKFHTDGIRVSYGWNSSFMRLKINFHTGENKFLCGRKFTGIREKINFFPYKNLRFTITVRRIWATVWLEVGTHGPCVRSCFSWQLTSKRVNKLIVTQHVGTHGSCVRSCFSWQLTSKWVNKLIVARHVGTHGPCVRSNKRVHALGNPPWTDARAVRPYFFTAK